MTLMDYFRPKVILEYNGTEYRLQHGDIPDLRGSGRIVVVNMPGYQRQYSKGNFANISLSQNGSASFINGVNIERLLMELGQRKSK